MKNETKRLLSVIRNQIRILNILVDQLEQQLYSADYVVSDSRSILRFILNLDRNNVHLTKRQLFYRLDNITNLPMLYEDLLFRGEIIEIKTYVFPVGTKTDKIKNVPN